MDRIVELENRVDYEVNLRILSVHNSKIAQAQKLLDQIGLSLLGIEDIANTLDKAPHDRIMYRVEEIKLTLARTIADEQNKLQKYLNR